jgi:diguanylate cyclase (GGDEF)-like protein
MQEPYDNSIRDGLTGMLNRRGAAEAIHKFQEGQPGNNATLLVDIDNLKLINEMHGHVAGDAIIVRTAEAIRESVREGDECVRIGGDEFMIFAPDCDADSAAEVAQRILSTLSRGDAPWADRSDSITD